MGAEHTVKAPAKSGIGDKERVDVFPHDLVFWGDFKELPLGCFSDEGIAISQSVDAAAHYGVHGKWRVICVFPNYFFGFRVYLDGS